MSRSLLPLACITAVLLLGACADEPAQVGSPDPSPTVTGTATSTPTPAPSATPTADDPAGDRGEFRSWTGTLGGSEIEGGCVWLEAEDGTRYELVAAPGGTVAVDTANLSLLRSDGTVFEGGAPITLDAALDPEAMSFCQIGPILMVRDVQAA